MSKSKGNDGGPAFPPHGSAFSFVGVQTGMTLREYFAAAALSGLCGNPGGPFQKNGMSGWGDVAKLCIQLADAMLAASEASNVES